MFVLCDYIICKSLNKKMDEDKTLTEKFTYGQPCEINQYIVIY